MEDDLKISNVEYLSNHRSDLTQMLNLNLSDQSKQPPMRDHLKLYIVEYLSNHWSAVAVDCGLSGVCARLASKPTDRHYLLLSFF